DKFNPRHAALIPPLHLNIAAGNRNERAIVRNAILGVALGGGHLVVVRETQLVVLQMKDGIGAPLVRIVWPAARAQSPAPLVGKPDFVPILSKRSRVPTAQAR